MIDIPFDLYYAWPKGIYLAPIIALFAICFWYLFSFRKKASKLFSSAKFVKRSKALFWIRALFLSLSWIFATFAIMKPLGNGHYVEGKMPQNTKDVNANLKRKAHDVIFLIDASASMAAKDARLGQSRLDNAKEIANEILASLNGESATLYAFTSQVELLSPLTLDSFFIRLMLNQLSINQGGTTGTNLVEAIASMKKAFFSKPSPKLKTLIVISDGGDTFIESLEGQEQKKAIESLGNLVENADSLQLRVYTVGIGSSSGAIVPEVSYNGSQVTTKLQAAPLKRLAEKGRGRYYEAEKFSSLAIADSIHEQMMQDPPYYSKENELVAGSLLQALIEDSNIIYTRYFQWPLALAIFFLILGIFLPQTRFVKGEKIL